MEKVEKKKEREKEKVKLVGDPGSCHGGSLKIAKQLVSVASDCGVDAVKFQLFKDKLPNIAICYDDFEELTEHAREKNIEIFASVWDVEGLELLEHCKIKTVKFAYSMRNNFLLKKALEMDTLPKHEKRYDKVIPYTFDEVIVSTDSMSAKSVTEDGLTLKYFKLPKYKRMKLLYCIPEYPVKYLIDFEGLFPLFHGFSSHTLGIEQELQAIRLGAKMIEKHYNIKDNDVDCPDALFAINPTQLEKLAKEIK